MPPPGFTTQSVTETRRRVIKALATAPGLLLVEGPSGCGKSHLKQQISGALARRFTLIDLPYSRLDPLQFATTLATRLGPGDPPATAPMARVQEQISACARSGRPLLLLIDDAQFMPTDTRAVLARLGQTKPKDTSSENTPRESESRAAPVYGLLFADPGANTRFALLPGADADRGLHQRMALAPPGQADMEGFLAAQPGSEALPADVREALVEDAQGSLRRLRQLLDLALLEQAGEAQERASGGEIEAETDSPGVRHEGRGGQFAFGLVGGEDFPAPGPATRRALERGNELDTLTASTDAQPRELAADRPDEGTLPVLYHDETPEPTPSRRLALRLGLMAGALAALVMMLLVDLPAFQEADQPPQLLAREQEREATPAEAAPTAVPEPSHSPQPSAPAPSETSTSAPPPEASGEPGAAAEPTLAPAPVVPADNTAAPTATVAPTGASTEQRDREGRLPDQRLPNQQIPVQDPAIPERPPPAQAGPASPAIDRWLDQARAHEAAYHLTLPSDDNAVRSYRQILTVNPDHAQARAGLARIKKLYRDRAEMALEQGEWEDARHNFGRLLWIDSSDREAITQLTRLVRRLEQAQADAYQQAGQ